MSLREKIVIIVSVVVVLFGVGVYGIQRVMVYPRFVELERAEAEKDFDRCIQAIQREAAALNTICEDYAAWNDTYEFVVKKNADYIKTSLSLTNLKDLGINVLYICDTKGEIVWRGSINLETKEWIEFRDFPQTRFPPSHPLVARASPQDQLSGMVATEQGPMLVASQPILNDESEGPVRGALIIGKFLTSSMLARLRDQTRVDLRFGSCFVTEKDAASGPITGETLKHGEVCMGHQERGVLHVSTVLMDIYGRLALPIDVVIPREITTKGRAAMGFATASLTAAALAVFVTLLMLLQQAVVEPLSRLTRHAIAIGQSDDLSARFGTDRQDEIGVLGRAFDSMVSQLAETRRRLLEESYKSGVAEMASGVLHNVRNALTPVLGEVEAIRQELAGTLLDQIEVARDELSAGMEDESRRRDLSRFLELANDRLLGVARETKAKLNSLVGRTRQIEQFLVDQEGASRADRPVEKVDLDGAVKEAVNLLSADLRQRISLDVGPSLAASGPVSAQRVCLLQVLANLLANAAESIRRSSVGQGRIHVSADVEESEGREMVHLRIKDDGCGIAAEDLSCIFERGFTTKVASYGLGLHWCANSVAAMNGRIYAESEGAGRGACFHVFLPKSQ